MGDDGDGGGGAAVVGIGSLVGGGGVNMVVVYWVEKWGGGRELVRRSKRTRGKRKASKRVCSIVHEQMRAQCVTVRSCAQGRTRQCTRACSNVHLIALVQECV